MIWTTKDGQRIPIREMTDRHITNCLRLLRKRLADIEKEEAGAIRCALSLSSPMGEHALDLYEAGIDDMLENGYEDPRRERTEKYIAAFEKELKKRSGQGGLDWSLIPERVQPD